MPICSASLVVPASVSLRSCADSDSHQNNQGSNARAHTTDHEYDT
uniref:Uncharacterized protein n=1 Tax=Anguilla anguilla TaxID=7936 RepID=A0A0E9XJL1_ANGAN